MRKPDKKITLVDMKKHIDGRYELLRDMMDKYELDSYMDGTDINGELVEESPDITPEQVAVLGAYSEIQMLHSLYRDKPNTKEEVELKDEVIKDGKVIKISMSELPREVQDYFKSLIKDEEDE